ncbi:Dihydrodipicolinate reductase [Mannheimia haemolytica]|uniref:Dihydrodipicolinate reductase n=1 Tax=Mannheimia haemolytica TaxID=75985 RepID=A0A378N7M6_MANHA|nr:Dihydrodipicolinate reductase [Mannheimia haemolytica]
MVISDDVAQNVAGFDLLIDFTRPEGTLEHLDICVAHHKQMVIGTTGFDDAGKAAIKAASEKSYRFCLKLQRWGESGV